MQNIINIEGRFDSALTNRVYAAFKSIPLDEIQVYLRINSLGGSRQVFIDISNLLCDMSEQRGYRIISQAKHAESAAFLLFINCPVRQVAAGSVGIIHLPVTKQKVEQEILDEIRKEVINFIIRRTKMTEKEITSLEGMYLGTATMLKYGIAKEKVPNFR